MSCKKIKGCEGKIAMKRRDFLLGSIASVAAPAAFAAEDSAEQKPTPPPPQPTPPPPKPAEKLSTVERFACPEDGLFAVRPHLQLLGERSAAVVWMTKRKATGFVEWSQDGGAKWKRDWTEEDGLRDAGSFVHKTVLTGFDPSKSVRFRACSRANPEVRAYSATFEGEVEKVESELNPIVPADGKVSFAMFNDVHNKLDSYPALLKYLDRPVNFTVFNGDIMNSVETEEGLKKNLLAPLAYTSEKTHAAMWYLRGNHETRGAMARQLRDYLALPEGHYFGAVTLGAARIVFIDTGEDKHDSHPEYSGLVDFDHYIERQKAWLSREFASAAWKDAVFRIAVMHIPPADVSVLGRRGPIGGTKRTCALTEFLKGAGLSIALCGHYHWSANDDANETHPYPVVVGGGVGVSPKDKRGRFRDATITRCDYDANELVVTQTNILGEKLFERRIAAGTGAGSS
jgi:hypothetical protein